jgi:hypothetical protein
MFTAFNVTKLVWAKLQNDAGGDPAERWPRGWHNSIKGDIHAALQPYIQSCAYERDLQNVIGAAQMPFVYHPIGSDPDVYQGDICDAVIDPNLNVASLPGMIMGVNPLAAALASSSSPAPALAAPPVATIPDKNGGDSSDGFTRKLTPYSRLTVPNVLIRNVGLGKGDTAYLLVGNNQCTITKALPPNSGDYRTYIVDEDCNVRLSASHLAKAGMDTAQKFKFRTVGGGSVIIEQA